MSLDPDLRNKIRRLFYVKHFTINAIAESQGVHHSTVKSAINYESFQKRRKRYSLSKWKEYEAVIEENLKIYPKLTCTRLHKILTDQGFSVGSLGSLRRLVRSIRPRVKEAFIRRQPLIGEEAQVDWGHFGRLNIEGAVRKLYLFVMTLSWSRYTYAEFTLSLSTETFLNCHGKAFQAFNGVPEKILYDNLKSAVIERQGDIIRYNPMLLDFSAHYHFEPKACNPYRGNEKGRVERKIRFVREGFFEGRELGDLQQLNKELHAWLDLAANQGPWPDNKAQTVQVKFLEEQAKLIRLPAHHPILETRKTVYAGKYARIKFDLNHYSIPAKYVQRSLLVGASMDKVRIYAENEMIAEHARSWTRDQEVWDESHRKDLIAKKKHGALQASRNMLLEEFPKLTKVLEIAKERGEILSKTISRLTSLRTQYGSTSFGEAIDVALANERYSCEAITIILNTNQAKKNKPPSISPVTGPDKVKNLQIKSHDLNSYDTI